MLFWIKHIFFYFYDHYWISPPCFFNESRLNGESLKRTSHASFVLCNELFWICIFQRFFFDWLATRVPNGRIKIRIRTEKCPWWRHCILPDEDETFMRSIVLNGSVISEIIKIWNFTDNEGQRTQSDVNCSRDLFLVRWAKYYKKL